MGRSVRLLILMMLFQTGIAQAQEGILPWSYERLLVWSDFVGQPDEPESIYAAATYAGLSLDVTDVSFSGRVSFKVRAVFDSHRSWVNTARLDDALLAHEQLHFDIAEVYARRLERKLNAMQLKVRDKEVAKKLLAQYNTAQMQEQKRFDKECVHGLNREHEHKWRSKIDRELRIKRAQATASAVGSK